MTQPLFLFLPGAFASMGADIQEEAAAALPGTELMFHEFVPSGLLAQEIRDGAPADVYVSANTRFMTGLHEAGFVPSPELLAGNRLCIIVRPDAASQIRALDDLIRPTTTLVTPQSQTDPCGQYVVELFERAGITAHIDAKREAGTLMHSRGSGDLPGYLFDGRAQAGIFYHSETIALGSRVAVIDSRAQPMVDWFLGSAGQALLERHGFLPLPTLR